MGRAEAGTPKFLANKMKAKGLQKLRWYCQMCQKQCRDENGFKCHTMSEAHQRQLLLFSDNSSKIINDFSSEFVKGYMDIVRRQFGTKRVNANKVYQEYIADKNHVHMNSTRWTTLKGFCMFLGKTGQVIADETEKGWYITYIDRDPETLERQEKSAKKKKMDKDDEERLLQFVNKQVERAKKDDGTDEAEPTEAKEFRRENEEDLVKLNLSIKPGPSKATLEAKPVFKRPFDKVDKYKDNDDDDRMSVVSGASAISVKRRSKDEVRKPNALDEIMQSEEHKKERSNRKDYWLAEGIVVKIVTKSLGEKFYKAKGVVKEVVDKYAAKVKLLETGDKLKLDQSHLETVIPQQGKDVLVVNGAYRGSRATLTNVDERNFCVSIEIASGPLKGRVLNNVEYEDISKLYDK